MPNFNSRKAILAAGALSGLVGAAAGPMLAAEPGGSTPDFSSNNSAWVLTNGDYIPIPGGPGPTRNDPAHPYVTNNVFRSTGAQPTFRVADLTNPNIKPWAKEVMKRENGKVLSGGIPYGARASCMPAGVPAFMAFAVVEPIHFMQTPKQVTMIFSGDAQVRRVYLDVPHSPSPKPSWYGESVGHYEGDTLVVDTIAMNDKTYLDNFRTPHTEKLHVPGPQPTTSRGSKCPCMRKLAPKTTSICSTTTYRLPTSRTSEQRQPFPSPLAEKGRGQIFWCGRHPEYDSNVELSVRARCQCISKAHGMGMRRLYRPAGARLRVPCRC